MLFDSLSLSKSEVVTLLHYIFVAVGLLFAVCATLSMVQSALTVILNWKTQLMPKVKGSFNLTPIDLIFLRPNQGKGVDQVHFLWFVLGTTIALFGIASIAVVVVSILVISLIRSALGLIQ